MDDPGVPVLDEAFKLLEQVETTSAVDPQPGDSATISMTMIVKNVDPDICRNLLWDLAHMAHRGLFEFSQHSDEKARIAMNELEAHPQIVTASFRYLNEEPDPRIKNIGHYLVCWLPDHLAGLRRLRMHQRPRLLAPREYEDIGQNLYMLFKDFIHVCAIQRRTAHVNVEASEFAFLEGADRVRCFEQPYRRGYRPMCSGLVCR